MEIASLQIEPAKSVKSQKQEEYVQYPQRFLMVTLSAVLLLIVGAQWVTAGPIQTGIERVYGQPQIIITFLNIIFDIIYLPLNFPVNWIVDVKGPRLSICIGAILIFVGGGIRCLVQFSFYFVIVGQVICACGEVFLSNCITKIIVNWFAPKTHSVLIIILANMLYLGSSVGYQFPDAFVSSSASNEHFETQFRNLLLFQFALTVIPGIITLVMFKDNPPTPPSCLPPVDHSSYKKQICQLLKNKSFMYINLAMGLYCGIFYAFPALLDNLLNSYGYTQTQVSILGFIMLAGGVAFAIVVGIYVQNTLDYVRTFRFCIIFGFLQCAFFPLLLEYIGHNFPVAVVLTIVQAIAFLPVPPITIDYSINVFYPKGEALVTGCLFTSSGLFGTLFSLAVPPIFGLAKAGNTNQQNQRASLWTVITFSIIAGLGGVMYLFFNHRLTRTEEQKATAAGQPLLNANTERDDSIEVKDTPQ